jgi:signal transduction histidine kinase
MLSCIAHELGNPLNVIKGFAELMQADVHTSMPAAHAEKLRHILEAAHRLSGLLADVTDVARLEVGRFTVALADVALQRLVHPACEQARAQAAPAGMTLHAHLADLPESLRVRADPRRLRQCLDNLLSNAIKYGRDGRRIDVQAARHGAEVVLAVQDHGPGLTDGQLAQLFEPYNRLGQDGSTIPGTGLGLLLTRELAQAMGGRLVVHGRPGRGARFELWLPVSNRE